MEPLWPRIPEQLFRETYVEGLNWIDDLIHKLEAEIEQNQEK